jgi:hypothetical protein
VSRFQPNLINSDIAEAEPSGDAEKPRRFEIDRLNGLVITYCSYIVKDGDELIIRSRANAVQLHGDYEIDIRLTKKEIANLARAVFNNDRFGTVVHVLSRKKRASPKRRAIVR